MNSKYTVIIFSLMTLAGTSCWGAAQQKYERLPKWLTYLWAACDPRLAAPLQQMEFDAPDDAAAVEQLAKAARTVRPISELEELPSEMFAEIAKSLNPLDAMNLALAFPKLELFVRSPLFQLVKLHIDQNNGNLKTTFFDAIKNDYPGAMEVAAYLARHIDANARDESGETALMAAANINNEVVEILINRGADVNAKDKKGKTALMRGASTPPSYELCKKIVLTLLDHGADRSLRDIDGNNASDYAYRDNCFTAMLALDYYNPKVN